MREIVENSVEKRWYNTKLIGMWKDEAIYFYSELAQLYFSMILLVNNNDNILCIFLCFISIIVSDISCRIFFYIVTVVARGMI